MVSERYQDRAKVSTKASVNNPRMDNRTASKLSSTSRASRVTNKIPIEARLRITGSEIVTSSRLSSVRRM